MIQIKIISVKRNNSSLEFYYKMWFVLPAIYGTGAIPIKGLDVILASYTDGFATEIISPNGTVITFTEVVNTPITITLAQIKSQLQTKYAQIRTKLDSLTLTPYDTIAGLTWDGTNWI